MKEKLLKFLEEQNKKEQPGYNQGVDIPIVFDVEKDQNGVMTIDGEPVDSESFIPFLADIENLVEVDWKIFYEGEIPEEELKLKLPEIQQETEEQSDEDDEDDESDFELEIGGEIFNKDSWITLKKGSTSKLVSEMKQSLNTILIELELLDTPLVVDNNFDESMEKAVKIFQERLVGIENIVGEIGEIDYSTLESIYIYTMTAGENNDPEEEDSEEYNDLEEEDSEDYFEEDFDDKDNGLANKAISNINSFMSDRGINKCKIVLNYNVYQHGGNIFIVEPLRVCDRDLVCYGDLFIKKACKSIGL